MNRIDRISAILIQLQSHSLVKAQQNSATLPGYRCAALLHYQRKSVLQGFRCPGEYATTSIGVHSYTRNLFQ